MCVQYGGSQGLTSEQISTVTKHKVDKLHSAYMPEVEQETLKVMSGFKKWESRYVKTEHVQFPRDRPLYLQECTRILLPQYDRYVSEYNSPRGDHSTCGEKFLLHILPYFVETVLQCGYWFIKDYPMHPLSELLKVSTSTGIKYYYFIILLLLTSTVTNYLYWYLVPCICRISPTTSATHQRLGPLWTWYILSVATSMRRP